MTTIINTLEAVSENTLVAELDAAKTYTDLKKVAAAHPDIYKDYKGYKSFATLYEHMMDCLEPGILPESFDVEKNAEGVKQHDKKEKKAPKAPKEKVASAYGTAVQIMAKNPLLSYAELLKACQKKGFDKASAIRTANVAVKQIYGLLKANGFIAK
jgi:hypothetical protein